MTSQHTLEDVFTVLQGLSIRMDKRFDGFDQNIDGIKSHFNHRMDTLQEDITALRTDVATLQTNVSSVQTDVRTLQTDLDDLAMATKEGFDSVDRRFDAMTVRISRPWRRVWFD